MEIMLTKPITDIAPIVEKPKGVTENTQIQKEGNFGEMLKDAISEVEGLQQNAELQIEGLVTGKSDVTIHDAMISLEKADLSFQLMNQIRSKLIRAYEEIIRTQI